MQKKRLLWLVSWYPNENDAFVGDFIERHAQLAAERYAITVIHCITSTQHKSLKVVRESLMDGEEIKIYVPKHKKSSLAAAWLWWRTLQREISLYLQQGYPTGIHVHVPWKAGLMAWWWWKRKGIPYIITEHWGIYNSVVDDNFYRWPWYRQIAVKKLVRESKCFTAPSIFLLNEATKLLEYRGPRHELHNVVDTHLFKPSLLVKEGVFIFLHVSNMVPLKNVARLLDAFKKLHKKKANARLHLAGAEPKWVKEWIVTEGMVEVVQLTPEVPQPHIALLMQQAHCYVQNSIMENAPCVISEALCCGLPVIATAVGGVPEMIDDTNGLLVPSQNIEALCTAMSQMMDQAMWYDKLAISKKAGEKYGMDAVLATFSTLYNTYLR